LALCLGMIAVAGCYTTLRHPVSTGAPDDYGYNDYDNKNCYDCHDEAAFYHSYYGVYFDYYYGSPWFGYYSDPWWYDSYWGGGYVHDQPSPVSDRRHHWGRGAPSGGARGSTGMPAAPYLRKDYVKPSKSAPPPQKEGKPREQKSKKSSKKRHTGGRGKKK